MEKFFCYNVYKYINSYIGATEMTFEGIFSSYNKGKKYNISEKVSEYLQYVNEKPFYITPSFTDIKTDVRISSTKPKFVLFSAPGATGKSALAQYISYKFNALYWDLSKMTVGTGSFSGAIIDSVGPSNYSDFILNLSAGKAFLVIDAFDEAEIISGRKMISSFLMDINNNVESNDIPTVFLLARTETAQYIASLCCENLISLSHYEIGFFQESAAKDFVLKRIAEKGEPTRADEECVNLYYDVIWRNIMPEERASFLGYAPVLEAIAEHIRTSPNRAKLISEMEKRTDCVSFIMTIMSDLLKREQTDKVVNAFSKKCKDLHPEFCEWDKVYSEREQLVRIVNYVLFGDTSYSSYNISDFPPQLINDYQEILDTFLPQHPFVRSIFKNNAERGKKDFTGPAFRDYTLARLMLDNSETGLAELYFDTLQSQSYFPSQVFFDCYRALSGECIYSEHISYLYESFKAKAAAMERPYIQCSEVSDDNDDVAYVAVFGMITDKRSTPKDDIVLKLKVNNDELIFEQMANVSIDTPGLSVKIGKLGADLRVTNSSVICKNIIWMAKNVIIESFNPEGCLLVATESMTSSFYSMKMEIVRDYNLRVSSPDISSFYRLLPYKYNFEDTSDLDITKFIYALRCILMEFRTHGKDTLAKTADRIEHVTVGNSENKRNALNYLKNAGIIYEYKHLYKVDEIKMQEKGIFFAALARMDIELLMPAYNDYCKWMAENI